MLFVPVGALELIPPWKHFCLGPELVDHETRSHFFFQRWQVGEQTRKLDENHARGKRLKKTEYMGPSKVLQQKPSDENGGGKKMRLIEKYHGPVWKANKPIRSSNRIYANSTQT